MSCTYSPTDFKLNAVAANFCSVSEVPPEVMQHAPSVKSADFSFNALTDLSNLSSFRSLETLVLDNNELTSLDSLPELPRLITLWINKNSLKDIEGVLSVIAKRCPRLQYLSLLGNPCCSNELTGGATAEYNRLRLYVLYRVPTLKFLDAAPVTEQEREDAKKQGSYSKVIKLADTTSDTTAAPQSPGASDGAAANIGNAKLNFFKDDPEREGRHATYFSYQKQQYSGKSSEGNRFIKDDKL
eukprot:PhF_6_TR27005/c0_g1_i3/m.39429